MHAGLEITASPISSLMKLFRYSLTGARVT